MAGWSPFGVGLLRQLVHGLSTRDTQSGSILSTHKLGDVRVLGIDANDLRASAKAFVKKDRVTFPVAFDSNSTVTAGLFNFDTLPETVFLNDQGVVERVYFGAISISNFASGIEQLQR